MDGCPPPVRWVENWRSSWRPLASVQHETGSLMCNPVGKGIIEHDLAVVCSSSLQIAIWITQKSGKSTVHLWKGTWNGPPLQTQPSPMNQLRPESLVTFADQPIWSFLKKTGQQSIRLYHLSWLNWWSLAFTMMVKKTSKTFKDYSIGAGKKKWCDAASWWNEKGLNKDLFSMRYNSAKRS